MRGSGLSPICSETPFSHPISAAQPLGGVKAAEEFGEGAWSPNPLQETEPRERSEPPNSPAGGGHDSDTAPRELLAGKAKSPRPLLWLCGGRGHQIPLGSW